MEAAVNARLAGAEPSVAPVSAHYVRSNSRLARGAEVPLQFLCYPDDRRARNPAFVPRPRSETLCRVVNLGLASVAFTLAAPLMAVVALLVRITSQGPVIYSQTRVGIDRRWGQTRSDNRRVRDEGGKPFTMYKFRSMRADAEADGRAVWAQKEDSRVTPIGGFLRKTRIDELPQLYNVIRGDMNIVGPRPERPSIFAELRESIPEYSMRQRVKPGITGWAQINQAYDCCLDDVRNKVQYDLEYLQKQSLAMDLRIMSQTLPVMLFRRGQ